MKSKRGVSDVVATILVVLITIAAAAMLISFVLPFIQKNLDSGTECMKYQDYLKFAPELKYTCYENSGLHGFSIRAASLGEDSAEEQEEYVWLTHSADYNHDWKIDDGEMNRFGELYQYNTGTSATTRGRYRVQAGTVDGFNKGWVNEVQPSETSGYHSGDINKNWRLDNNLELSSVIVIYNHQENGVRTGEYHIGNTDGDGDGFDEGPGGPGEQPQLSALATSGNNDVLVGFEVRLSNSDGSVKASTYNGNATSTEVGSVRMLNRTLEYISIPDDGEIQTFVYNSGGAVYKTLEIYPVLKSGRLCDRTDVIEISACRGVTLTP